MFPVWADWNIEYTTRGLFKLRLQKTFKIVAFITAIVGAYSIRKDVRGGLMAWRGLLGRYIRSGVLSVLGLVDRGASRLIE